MSAYEIFQLDRYGNILPDVQGTPEEEYENGLEELDRLAEWTLAMAEKDLHKQE